MVHPVHIRINTEFVCTHVTRSLPQARGDKQSKINKYCYVIFRSSIIIHNNNNEVYFT